MTKKMIFTFLLITGLFCLTNGQTLRSVQNNPGSRIQNNNLGISFAKVGTVKQVDNSTYRISLSSSGSSAQPAFAQVATTSRLFVDLPGSYGGRLYLDSPAAAKLSQDKVLVDSVNTGQTKFHRTYWAVYAGMGMWDCVINCYVQQNGKYYVVSLIQNKLAGKPGEIVNGNKLKTDELKQKIVSELRDTSNPIVTKFNNLLSSFQINK